MIEKKRSVKSNFSSLSIGKKLQYYKDYYLKATLLGLIAMLLLTGMIRDFMVGRREFVFYALVINNYSEVPDDFREGFISFANLDEEQYNIIIDTTMKMNLERVDAMTTNYKNKIIAISSTRKQDLFLADEQIISYYWDAGYIEDLRVVLPEEFWRSYESKFYYLKGQNGEDVPVGILVADSPKLVEFHMFEDRQPILSVVYNAPDKENIQSFISYLYT